MAIISNQNHISYKTKQFINNLQIIHIALAWVRKICPSSRPVLCRYLCHHWSVSAPACERVTDKHFARRFVPHALEVQTILIMFNHNSQTADHNSTALHTHLSFPHFLSISIVSHPTNGWIYPNVPHQKTRWEINGSSYNLFVLPPTLSYMWTVKIQCDKWAARY